MDFKKKEYNGYLIDMREFEISLVPLWESLFIITLNLFTIPSLLEDLSYFFCGDTFLRTYVNILDEKYLIL